MEAIYYLLPFSLMVGVAVVGVLFWAIKSGQYDDIDGAAARILMDEDDPLLPESYKSAPPKQIDRAEKH